MSNKKIPTGLYLIDISTYAPQNNFHRQARALLLGKDRLLIENPEAFITALSENIRKIHLHHPRTKSAGFWTSYYENSDPSFGIEGICSITFRVIKGKYLDGVCQPFLPGMQKGGEDER